MFGRIKDSITYTWNGNDGLRHWIKGLTCPCLCCCYFVSCVVNMQFGRRQRGPTRRHLKMSNVSRSRRERQFKNRKRSVSVDGKRNTTNAKGQDQSLFFSSLPAELRLKIYEMVLCNDNGLKIVDNNARFIDYYRILAVNLPSINLLLTCKRIYREAVPTLYTKNNFRFEYISALIIFSECILPKRLQQIRSITLRDVKFANYKGVPPPVYNSTPHKFYSIPDLFAMLSSMRGLRTVTLHYVLTDSAYEKHLNTSPFPLIDKFPTESLPPSCRVLYKVEGISDYLRESAGHAGDITKSSSLERWWSDVYNINF